LGENASSQREIGVRKASVRGIETRRGAPARGPAPAVPAKPVAGALILLAISFAAYLAVVHFKPPRPTETADMHSGSIVIPFAGYTACRHLTFDNATGSIKDEGTGRCADSSPGAAERLNQVSQSFQRR
jgi:hypothetical protein